MNSIETPDAGKNRRSIARSVVVLVSVAALVGLFLRLIGLGQPPFDAHMFRQCQTLSTIENYYSYGVDFLHPKTIYMGCPGDFVLEFPLFQGICAGLYKVFGPHIEIVRILNIIVGTITAWLVYLTTKRLVDRRAGALAALIYWLAPLNVLYHRSVLFDPFAVMLSLISFSTLDFLLTAQTARKEAVAFWAFAFATTLTALLKPLYLWPSVVLLGAFLVSRRLSTMQKSLKLMTVFAVSGISFLAWNHHCREINDISFFTRGTNPTSLLGMTELLNPFFYYVSCIGRPKWWLGVFGAAFYLVGLGATFFSGSRYRNLRLIVIALIPPGYLLLFANINLPHDYYQLVITPYLAVTAGIGCSHFFGWISQKDTTSGFGWNRQLLSAWILLLLTVAIYFAKFGPPQPNARVLTFQNVFKSRIERGSYGVVLVDPQSSGSKPGSYIPEYLYAAGLWGHGRVVRDSKDATAEFAKVEPAFPQMEYLILYGVIPQADLLNSGFRVLIGDPERKAFLLRRDPKQPAGRLSGLL